MSPASPVLIFRVCAGSLLSKASCGSKRNLAGCSGMRMEPPQNPRAALGPRGQQAAGRAGPKCFLPAVFAMSQEGAWNITGICDTSFPCN